MPCASIHPFCSVSLCLFRFSLGGRPPGGCNTQAHRREGGRVVSAPGFDGRSWRRSSPRKRLNRRRRSDRLDEIRLQIAAIGIQIMRRSHWECQRIERGMKNRYGVVCAHSSILAGSSSLRKGRRPVVAILKCIIGSTKLLVHCALSSD